MMTEIKVSAFILFSRAWPGVIQIYNPSLTDIPEFEFCGMKEFNDGRQCFEQASVCDDTKLYKSLLLEVYLHVKT